MTRVLITGGEGDMARALAEALGDAHEVLAPGRSELDVRQPESVRSFVAGKQVDVLVNNAGTLHSARFLDTDRDQWVRDIEVGLIGSYLVTREVLEHNPQAMIINVGSTAAFSAYRDWSSYCVAKAGVVTLTRSLANDGYAAYCVCPGAIDTKLRDGLNIDNPKVMTRAEGVAPIVDIIEGGFTAGDILLYRKGEFVLNPPAPPLLPQS